MNDKGKNRRIHSVKRQLITKAREAALAAVQTHNNPLIQFKSETFIVQMIIAWTYLLHAYYRDRKVEYRYHDVLANGRRKFQKTKRGSDRHWDLERCLNEPRSPLDGATASNLRFLIGLRHEIEHQMSRSIDDYLSGRYQACALNFNRSIKQLFGEQYGVDVQLAFSIQFAELSPEEVEQLTEADDIPKRVKSYVDDFDKEVPDSDFQSPHYSYRILFTRKLTSKKGQADRAVEFIGSDSPLAAEIDKQYWVTKEVERPKLKAGDVVRTVKQDGYKLFNMHHHTLLWRQLDAKNPGRGYGVDVAGTWYWYERWLNEVRRHCQENRSTYAVELDVSAESRQATRPRAEVPGHLRREAGGEIVS